MISRRDFIRQSSLAGIAICAAPGAPSFIRDEPGFSFESAFLKVSLQRSAPAFSFFSTDSLGGHAFAVSPLLAGKGQDPRGGERTLPVYESRVEGSRISYYLKDGEGPKNGNDNPPAWECIMEERQFTLRTAWKEGMAADPFTFLFSQPANHCTVLGEMTGEKEMKLPCLLHLPGMGTFRIYGSHPELRFLYDADRNVKEPFIQISLPPADRRYPVIDYRFESVAIFPEIGKIKGDPRFDGFRKNYINIFQVNPRIRALANNSASDACAFTLFLYAAMARHTPALVGDLTAMRLVRDTLDRYLGDMKAYGQLGYAGWNSTFDSSDSFPSLIISACYYIRDTRDLDWARKNYPGISSWAKRVMATDTNGDGITEYGYSGNAGSWDGKKRPANWWDAVGFGHDDAYSNILVYHALEQLSGVARLLKQQEDSRSFSAFAARLRSHYFDHFYNKETGVLGGWRSADGQLHDYYFLFVNSMAVCYRIIDKGQGRQIMQTLLRKMREVGYTDFRLGLPGNLIPVKGEDYSDKSPRWGFGGENGQKAFQVYENGGASGCYAYYTLHALYQLGMNKEAEEILFPMLESYKTGGFEGSCEKGGMTKDWKTWTGDCWGYEGFLVDNYMALLAVLDYGGLKAGAAD